MLSMKIKVGLVGLPNVGKSTLFNAIAQKSIAENKNFPFCTVSGVLLCSGLIYHTFIVGL